MGESAKKALSLGKRLAKATGLEVVYVDEAETTVEAMEAMLTADLSRAKLRTSGLARGSRALDLLLAKAYEDLAEGVPNTNGRGYLLRRARELRQGLDPLVPVKLPQRMVDGIPLDHIFSILVARLIPERAMDVHESLVFELPDKASRYVLTVRRGICELAKGEPLPGTPAPVGVITMQPGDFRKMALKIEGPLSLYTRGKISLDGGWIDTLAFLRRFGTD